MNIGIFTNNYLPNPYGVTASIENFRGELERRGHSVYIFAPRWKGYADENPNVFRYPSVDIPYKFRFPLPIPYSRETSSALQKIPLDIIHSQHPNLLGSAARKWARKKNIPLVFTWHTLYTRYDNFGPPLVGGWYVRRMVRSAVRYANESDAVIAPTNSAREEVVEWGVKREKVSVIPTGVREEDILGGDGMRVRAKYGIAPGRTVILTVSRMTEEKNPEFLLEAMVSVLRKNINAVFLAAGGGYLVEKLRARASESGAGDRIFFTGEVSRQELRDCFSAADMFVYASMSETQGVSVTEAMLAGLPVVAVRSSGVEDVVSGGVTGILTEENRADFACAVGDLLLSGKKRERFSIAARVAIQKKFSISVATNQMLSVYAAALARHNAEK